MNRISSSLLMVLLTLGGFALRLYALDQFSLRGDESFTVLFVQKPLEQMWHETLTVEPNPPLMYFLLRGWIALAGASEFATRFVSAWFGVLCIPLLYRLARELLGFARPSRSALGFSARDPRRSTPVALLAALLLAVNPYQVWHSQDVRNYTLWPALSLLALVFLWQYLNAIHARNERHAFLALVAFGAAELAALYSHYYEAFTLLALNVFVLLCLWGNWRRWGQWLAAQIALAVLYLPYPLLLSNRVSSYGEGSGRQGVALWEVWRGTFSAFTLGETLDAAWQGWLWVPLALLALGGLAALWRANRTRALFLALYASIPTLAVFALNVVRPLYLERYLNGIAPAYYLMLAYGLAALWQAQATDVRRTFGGASHIAMTRSGRALAALSLAGLLALGGVALGNYFANPAYAKAPDWRGLATLVNLNAQPGDIIIQNFPEMSLLYYDRAELPLVVYPEAYIPDANTPRALSAINSNYQRIWFIPAAEGFWDPDSYVQKWLDQHDDLLSESAVGDLRLRLYATPSLFLNTLEKLNARVGDLATLLGYRLDRVEGDLRVVLYWRAHSAPGKDYQIVLRLLTQDGRVLAERQAMPVGGALPTSAWRPNLLVVDQHRLPFDPAAVTLEISVLDTDTGTHLPVSNGPRPRRPDAIIVPAVP